MQHKIFRTDPHLRAFEQDFDLRQELYQQKINTLLQPGQTLADFASGYEYFGFHPTDSGWVYREWAPGADQLYLTGDFCGWDRRCCPMHRLDGGIWEIYLEGEHALQEGQHVCAIVCKDGRELERIPAYATRVVQDSQTFSWCAVIHTPQVYPWTDEKFKPKKNLFIYECHVGMAQEEGKVGSYREFTQNILPRIRDLGYNTIQVMAVMEHPYYASFGYQVTNFFAAASRFGMPEDLKELINTAHTMGIAVLLDVVHSHAAGNTKEGLNEFDGTTYQYFHDGPKGDHSAWGTKCFDYGKTEVIHFLLSNLKYWLKEYHFDGFRFDGVTSMLYHDHGLGTSFDCNEKYFSLNTHVEAVTYLQLATQTVKEVKPNAILIAEDMSAMPGMCRPVADGGIGFDYRLAMGEPDMWIRLLRDQRDEDWDLNNIYFELANRRPKEKVIGYCESHDQALVGDKTLMFRMCDQEMYWSMDKGSDNQIIDRGMALHKMLRLLTMTLGGEGYLTFMGNEFGHPEWIDFPREGNGWSHHYCRRQWSLADNPQLRYHDLRTFDKDMVELARKYKVLAGQDRQLKLDNDRKTLVYEKGGLIFAYNFHPWRSYDGCFLPTPEAGTYQVFFSTDDFCYDGHGRVWHQSYDTLERDGKTGIRMYLPSRTAAVLKKV